MPKRDSCDRSVDQITKRVKQQDLETSVKYLKNVHEANPYATRITQEVLRSATRKREVVDNNAFSAGYTSFAKCPTKDMQKIIEHTHPSLDSARITALKVNEKAIVRHMFEFEYGLPPAFQWPPGPCHQHGVFEKVLAAWCDKNGGGRLHKVIDVTNLQNTIDIDWNKHGVYELFPSDPTEEPKTHVRHKPTGTKIAIPKTMNVDSAWSFQSNWSDKDAELVDYEGNAFKVSKFRLAEGQTSPFPQESDWVDFANRKAEEFAHKQEDQIGRRALEIVSGHMHIGTETSSHVFATDADEQTDEPPDNQ